MKLICASGAPLEKLLLYKERMGWGFNWVSTYGSNFNYDFQVSSTEEATREWAAPMLEDGLLPPIAIQNAEACGTDVISYIAEGFGFNSFAVKQRPSITHTLQTLEVWSSLWVTTRFSTERRWAAVKTVDSRHGCAVTMNITVNKRMLKSDVTGLLDNGRRPGAPPDSRCRFWLILPSK